MVIPGRRPRGRTKRRLMDVGEEDMKLLGETEEEGDDEDSCFTV